MNKVRVTRGTVAVGVVAAMLGFGLITQIRQQEDNPFSSMRQDDLVRYLDELTTRNDKLAAEEIELRAELDNLRVGADSSAAARAAAEEQARINGILAGTLPATGPGVVVRIVDDHNALTSSVMVTLFEELRNAGAESIEVNDIRITATSWVKREGQSLIVNGTPVSSPLTVRAIGNPETLSVALAIPGGATAQVKALNAAISVTESESVDITAVIDVPAPQYAQVVPKDNESA